MKLYLVRVPFILELLSFCSYGTLLKSYKINKRINKWHRGLYIEYLELNSKDVDNRDNDIKVIYLWNIDTLKLNMNPIDISLYYPSKTKLELNKIKCKTLYTSKICKTKSKDKMDLPKELERLYYWHSGNVEIDCSTLVYLNIKSFLPLNAININRCREGIEIETGLSLCLNVIIDRKEAEKVRRLKLLNKHFMDIEETLTKFTKIERLDVTAEFYEACKYSDRMKVYLHKNNDDGSWKDEIMYLKKRKKEGRVNSLPLFKVTLVDEDEREKEFRTCKECLESLLT